MMCDRCGERKASVHWTHIVNGERQDLNLCAECAGQQGMFTNPSNAMGDLLAALMGSNRSTRGEAQAVNVCEKCGYPLERFQKTGMLGCPDCYKQFEPWIQPILRRMQGNLAHRGMTPHTPQTVTTKSVEPRSNLDALRDKLKKAVSDEAYEEAARLRDEIKAIEQAEGKA